MITKTKTSLILLLFLSIIVSGCVEPREKENTISDTPVVAEVPKPDVSEIINNAIELRIENMYFVTLKFMKEQFTMDIGTLIENEASAEYRVIMVDERTYNQYVIGQKISSSLDSLGVIFNGDIAEYTVRPVEKEILSQYFWESSDSSQYEISQEQYDEALAQLKLKGKPLLDMPYSGVQKIEILDKNLSEYEIVKNQTLERYFITFEVKSETFTLSISKMLRNDANAQKITIEVPEDVFKKLNNDVWSPKLSTGSLIFKGHISQLTGRIIKKWVEADDKYVLVTTKEGREFIVKK